MQADSSFGQTSTRLPVTQSIIQGSGIGPCLYLIYASDLRTLFLQNVIIKYADDTTLLVGQHSLVDMAQEYNNVCSWSTQNKLSINIHKTKEIIFHRPAARNLSIRPGIERVKQATVLGIGVTDTLSTAAYVDRLLMQVNQRLYLLSLLQSSGLQRSSLHLLFNALVINKLTYAGQLTVDDKNRINAISRKATRRGLTLPEFDIDTIIDKSDRKLFRQATIPENPRKFFSCLSAPSSSPKNLHLQILPAT